MYEFTYIEKIHRYDIDIWLNGYIDMYVLSRSVVSNSLQPHSCSPPGSSVQAIYWSGLPCPPPGDLPNPGIKSRSFTLQADSLPAEPPWKPIDLCMDR